MSDPFKTAKSDPFTALKNVLDPIFLATTRNGIHIYKEMELLEEAMQHYDPNDKKSFISIIKALRAAFSQIEKFWRFHFDTIKESMDALAAEHHLPVMDWDKYLSRSDTQQKFPFSSHQQGYQEIELIPWLIEKSGRVFEALPLLEQANILIEYCTHFGFSPKATSHLEKDPDFLFRLITASEKNFSRICNTKLIFYLTDEQIAKTIIKFLPKLVQEHEDPFVQVEQLVNKINAILSNGRTLLTLLHSGNAMRVFEEYEADKPKECKLFKIYQSDEYKNRSQKQLPPSSEEGGFKPIF